MPENEKTTRGQRQAQPHKVGWFWRLAGLYGRQYRPIAMGVEDGDEGELGKNFLQDWFTQHLTISTDRKQRYRIFAEMDSFGTVSGILDVYAEEATQKDYDRGRSVWIESKSTAMVQAGDEALRNLQMEDRVTQIARRVAKNGDEWRRLIYSTGKGVLGWKYTKPASMHRLEDKYSRLIGFREDGQAFRGNKKRVVSWPWDYVHFRMLGKGEEDGYGTAMLDGIFRPWRQLTLAEDAVLMYRIRRAPDRNMVMVDVGNLEEHEAIEFLNNWRKRFRKYEFIDPASPNYKKQYNPLTPMEDIFIAMRKDNQTRVESLSGSGTVGEIYDLDHFRNKFFGAAKVPKAYFGYEGEINCLDLGTEVPCLDGVSRTLKQIISDYEATGWLPWVYAWNKQTGRIVPGRVEWAGVTRKKAELVEVELDDGSRHVCTPDHRWYALDGSEVEARNLVSGTQLLPLRRAVRKSKSYHGYEKVYHPYAGYNNRDVPELTHLLVAEALKPGYKAGYEQPNVHHRNDQKRDNDPRNLEICEMSQHLADHRTTRFEALTEYRRESGAWNKGVTKESDDPRAAQLRQTTYITKRCLECGVSFTVPLVRRRKKFCSSSCAGKWGSRARVSAGRLVVLCQHCGEEIQTTRSRINDNRARFCSHACRSAYCRKRRLGLIPVGNHAVRSVRYLTERRDTGDITVSTHHNLFIADAGMGGVLVHNSKATLMQQDIRFARTIKRLQRSVTYGIRQALEVHYTLLPEKPSDERYDFTKADKAFLVKMSPIAYLDEWERLELIELRYRIVEAMSRLATDLQLDPRVWAIYILLNYAKLPEELVQKLIKPTPDEPVGTAGAGGEGGFGGFESLPPSVKDVIQQMEPKQRAVIMEDMGPSLRQGFYPLSEEEQLEMAHAIHESAPLRRIIGDIAYFHEHDILDEAYQQIDPAMLPPTVEGVVLADDYQDDDEAKVLLEDIAALTPAKPLDEGDEA